MQTKRRHVVALLAAGAAGMKFAIDYYGIDRVTYGSDYLCWDPATALKPIEEIGLPEDDEDKLLFRNARRIRAVREEIIADVPEEASAAAVA